MSLVALISNTNTDVFDWVVEQFDNIDPKAISLDIDENMLYHYLSLLDGNLADWDDLSKELSVFNSSDAYSAAIAYSQDNGLPLHLIGRKETWHRIKKDYNQPLPTKTSQKIENLVQITGNYESNTRTNTIIAANLSSLSMIIGYESIVHVGDQKTFDKSYGIPVQDIVKADFMMIIDPAKQTYELRSNR